MHFLPFDIQAPEATLDMQLLHATPQLKRVEVRGNRFYYHTDSDRYLGISDLYPSVTTVTKYMPAVEQEQLSRWRASLGNEEADRYMNSRADYGTLLHLVFAEYLRRVAMVGAATAPIYIEEVRAALVTYAQGIGRGLGWAEDHWLELRRDMISLRFFCQVYEFEPYLIEKSIHSEKYGFAGTLDLLGKITIGERYGAKTKRPYALKDPGKARRVLMLADLKSGKAKSLYAAHAAQLQLLKLLVEDVYGVQVEALYKLQPTEWKKNPDFSIMDAMGSKWNKQVIPLLDLARMNLAEAETWPYMTDLLLDDDQLTPGTSEIRVMSVREAIERYETGTPDNTLANSSRMALESAVAADLQRTFNQYQS